MTETEQATVLSVLARRFKSILGASLVLAAATFGGSYLLHDRFTATAVILPPREEADLGSLLSGLAGSPALSRAFGLSNSSGTELYLGVLQSRTVADRLIQRFDLVRTYHVSDVEKAERRLKKRTAITTTPEEFVRVAVTDENRERAAAIANAYLEELDRFLQLNTNTSARLRREFLDRRLADAQSALALAEDRLRDFQVKLKLPVSGADAAADMAGSLLSQRVTREIELGTLQQVSREETPREEQLRAELRQIDEQIDRIPPAATQGERLIREVKIEEKVVLVLTEERERARMLELRNVATVEVLDRAQPPVRKSWPRRTLMTGGVFLVAIAGNTMLAWLSGSRRRAANSVA